MVKMLIWAAAATLAVVGGVVVWRRRERLADEARGRIRDVRQRLATSVRKGGRRAQRASSKLARQLA